MKWCEHIKQRTDECRIEGEDEFWTAITPDTWGVWKVTMFCPLCGTPRPEPKEAKKWAPMLIIFEGNGCQISTTLYCGKPEKFGEALYLETIREVVWPCPGFTPVEIPELEDK